MSFDPGHTPTPPPLGPISDGSNPASTSGVNPASFGDGSTNQSSSNQSASQQSNSGDSHTNPLSGDPSVWKPGEPVFPNIDDFRQAQEAFQKQQSVAPAPPTPTPTPAQPTPQQVQPPAPAQPTPQQVQPPAPAQPAPQPVQPAPSFNLPDLDIQEVNLTNSGGSFDPFDPLGLNQLSNFQQNTVPQPGQPQAPAPQSSESAAPQFQNQIAQPSEVAPMPNQMQQGMQQQYPGMPPMPNQMQQGMQQQYPGMPPMPGQMPGQPGMPPQDNTPANFKIGAKVSDKTPIKLPKHNLNFDESKFLRLLASSISLSKQEKKKIIDTVPNLRQQQIDDLIKIFEDESAKFAELPKRHQQELEKMVEKHRREWEDLEDEYRTHGQKEQEKNQVDDIKKQLGL